MELTSEEIDLLIKKLRDKYTTYARKYSQNWFNIHSFEKRLETAINNKMNLNGFILAEIKNFETILEKYEKKKNERC